MREGRGRKWIPSQLGERPTGEDTHRGPMDLVHGLMEATHGLDVIGVLAEITDELALAGLHDIH